MIHVVTLAFAPHKVLRRGLTRFYETTDFQTTPHFKHYVVDQHYPIKREENVRETDYLRRIFGFTLLDSGFNRGYHNGLNWAIEQIKPQDGDTIFVYDPDGGPTHQGWLAAAETVLRKGGFALACITDTRAAKELADRGYSESKVDEIRVWEPKEACVFSMVAWDYGFIKAMGKLDEENPYYGGLEAYTWAHLKRLGLKWAYLPDFNEENSARDMADPEFTFWKWAHAHDKNFTGSFAEYLAAGCPKAKEHVGAP